MTDKELFLKYNGKRNSNDQLNKQEAAWLLYNNKVLTDTEVRQNGLGLNNKWTLLLTGTYACNLNCIYCENAMLRKKYHNAVITEDLVKQIIRKLGPNTINITWHGGESTLLDDNLLIALEEERKKYNYDIKIDLQTNGVALTPEKEELYKKLNISYGSSFDGKWNSESRGKKSTEAILNLLETHDGNFGFIAVTTNLNVDKLIENYEYYKSINLKAHIQNSMVRESSGVGKNDFIIPNEIGIKRVLEYFDYWIHDINNPINDSWLLSLASRVLGWGHRCLETPCLGGWLVIDPLGNITCCGGDGLNKEDVYVNLNDIQDYRDILTNSKYIKAINAQKALIENNCKNCEWLSSCYGGCFAVDYEVDKSYKTINTRMCEFNHAILDGVYEIIKNIPLEDRVETKYNKYFLQVLNDNMYFSLDECKKIEEGEGVY